MKVYIVVETTRWEGSRNIAVYDNKAEADLDASFRDEYKDCSDVLFWVQEMTVQSRFIPGETSK